MAVSILPPACYRFSLIWLCLSLSLLLISSAATADIYVNNLAGHDAADGRAAAGAGTSAVAGPVRTIKRALELATPGERIILARTEEPYRESISLVGPRHSGGPGGTFSIAGNGAVLDGTAAIPEEAWEQVQPGVFRFRPTEKTFQMLYRDGRPLVQVHVPTSEERLPALKPLEWCLRGGHVYLRMEKLKRPAHYNLSHSVLRNGVTLYGVSHVEISDLIVQGYCYDGISAADRAAEVRLLRVTLRGNGRSGLSVTGASQVTLKESLVGDNGQAQIRVELPAVARIEQCDVIGNTAPQFARINGGRIEVQK